MRRVVVAAIAALAWPGAAHAGEESLTFTTGPVMIKPYFTAQGAMRAPSPTVDGYVTGITVQVVDTAGNALGPQDVMLHHVVFAKVARRDLTCGSFGGLPAERFFAQGEERYSLAFPAGYGYPNAGADIWGMVYMLMNHHKRTETVHVRYTVRYVTDEQLTPVTPVWLDIRNCSPDPVWDVPGTGGRGSTSTRSVDYAMPMSGRLVAGGAHLHGGGVKLELADATCARTLFTSLPTWKNLQPKPLLHEEGPSHMSAFVTPEGLPVAAGDRLRLSAVYDNSIPHTRVMGIMMVYLAQAEVTGCPDVPAPVIDLGEPSAPPLLKLPLPTQPRGPAKRVTKTWVGDYKFGQPRVTLRPGTRFTWQFIGSEDHNVTLANGPVGFSSPSLRGGATFSYRFARAGRYELFCSLHPVAMSQVVTVR